MKKDRQLATNNFVLKMYDVMMDEFAEKMWYDAVRLRSCQACVFETENFFVLKSYETIVAFIFKETGEKFDILRKVYGYTSTSAQHISKFFQDFSNIGIIGRYTYREV